MAQRIVRAYREHLAHYEELLKVASASVDQLLRQADLQIHHLTGRLKKPESLREKLHRKPERYQTLGDVTDLVGLRIITYFERDVWQVSRLLEEHFEVDWQHSVDKRRLRDPDRFGYMGVHYVLRAARQDGAVGQIDCPHDLHFEVQIRSILQHAWAEIEHDLGYKSKAAVPRDIRRRFYRLAGLLEMADEEFMTIHRLAEEHARNLPERLRADPDAVEIDAGSMQELMSQPLILRLDEQLARAVGTTVDVRSPQSEWAQDLVAALRYLRVGTAGQLLREVALSEHELVHFAGRLLPTVPRMWWPGLGFRPGVCLALFAVWKAAGDSVNSLEDVARLLDLESLSGRAQTLTELQATTRPDRSERG